MNQRLECGSVAEWGLDLSAFGVNGKIECPTSSLNLKNRKDWNKCQLKMIQRPVDNNQ
jgi:hypothetical protein